MTLVCVICVSRFSHVTTKSWLEPGDEARECVRNLWWKYNTEVGQLARNVKERVNFLLEGCGCKIKCQTTNAYTSKLAVSVDHIASA